MFDSVEHFTKIAVMVADCVTYVVCRLNTVSICFLIFVFIFFNNQQKKVVTLFGVIRTMPLTTVGLGAWRDSPSLSP